MKATPASQLNALMWAARRFGRNRAWALDARRHGDIEAAREHAKNARADWLQLQTLAPEILHLIAR